MAGKRKNQNFSQSLETLRAHGFETAPFAGVPGGVMVSKQGVAAVIIPVKDGPVQDGSGMDGAAYWEHPGAVIQGEIARLLDRGYQKFMKTSKFEIPATAVQLENIHRFSEELNLLTGGISLYNQALGTTSDVYQYDRLKGREAAQPAPHRPWELTGGH
jgi:hypothetical protein